MFGPIWKSLVSQSEQLAKSASSSATSFRLRTRTPEIPPRMMDDLSYSKVRHSLTSVPSIIRIHGLPKSGVLQLSGKYCLVGNGNSGNAIVLYSRDFSGNYTYICWSKALLLARHVVWETTSRKKKNIKNINHDKSQDTKLKLAKKRKERKN